MKKLENVKLSLKDSGKEVEMRIPLVRDMRAISNIKEAEEKEIALISNLTGLGKEELDELTLRDYGILQKGLNDFLQAN